MRAAWRLAKHRKALHVRAARPPGVGPGALRAQREHARAMELAAEVAAVTEQRRELAKAQRLVKLQQAAQSTQSQDSAKIGKRSNIAL